MNLRRLVRKGKGDDGCGCLLLIIGAILLACLSSKCDQINRLEKKVDRLEKSHEGSKK